MTIAALVFMAAAHAGNGLQEPEVCLDLQHDAVDGTRDLGDRIRAQSDRCVHTLARILYERDALINTVYEVVMDLVNELLKYNRGV